MCCRGDFRDVYKQRVYLGARVRCAISVGSLLCPPLPLLWFDTMLISLSLFHIPQLI